MAPLQIEHRRFGCEFDVRLVDHDQPGSGHGRANRLDHGRWQQVAGRIVRRTQKRDAAIGGALDQIGRRLPVSVALDQRRFNQFGTLDPGRQRVHAEAGRADQHPVDACAAEHPHQQVDALVTATGNQEPFRLRAIEFGQPGLEPRGLRVRIAVQRHSAVAFGWIRVLVGIEQDAGGIGQGARRGVGLERTNFGASQCRNVGDLVHCRAPAMQCGNLPAGEAVSSPPSTAFAFEQAFSARDGKYGSKAVFAITRLMTRRPGAIRSPIGAHPVLRGPRFLRPTGQLLSARPGSPTARSSGA